MAALADPLPPADAPRPTPPSRIEGQLAIKNPVFFGSDAWVESKCSFDPIKNTLSIQGPGEEQPREVQVKGAKPLAVKVPGAMSTRRPHRFDIELENDEQSLQVAADSEDSKANWVTAICGTAGGDFGPLSYEDDSIAVYGSGILVKNYYYGTCEHKFIWYADIRCVHLPLPEEGRLIPGHGWGAVTGWSPFGALRRYAMGRSYEDVWFAFNGQAVRHRHNYIILTEHGNFRKGFVVRGGRAQRVAVAGMIRDGVTALRGEAPDWMGELPGAEALSPGPPLPVVTGSANPF